MKGDGYGETGVPSSGCLRCIWLLVGKMSERSHPCLSDLGYLSCWRLPYLGKAQQLQEQRYPLLSVYVVFFVAKQWCGCQRFGIFNVHPDAQYSLA